MFKSVKLQNYRSLVDFDVSFKGKGRLPKKLIIIYGESGIGKTDLLSAFYTLVDISQTKSLINKLSNSFDFDDKNSLLNDKFFKHYRSIKDIIRDCKTVDADGNMRMEFEFVIGGREGSYKIEFDDEKIVYEAMTYILNRNKTIYFEANGDDIRLNKGIFLSYDYYKELLQQAKRNFGKHSILSIFTSNLEGEIPSYIRDNMSATLIEVINYFKELAIRMRERVWIQKSILYPESNILVNASEGRVHINNRKVLDKMEKILDEYFINSTKDIKEVYYSRYTDDKYINYRLVFKKLISNKIRRIDYAGASHGNKNTLKLIPFLLLAMQKKTVILDEIDYGIHGIILSKLLESLYDKIGDQVIFATHNIMLLESKLPKDSMYIFNYDKNFKKTLRSLNYFEDRLHPNLNMRKRYLTGIYGGIPTNVNIDFDKLMHHLEV